MSNIVTHLGQNKKWVASRYARNSFTITFTNGGVAFDISALTFSLVIRQRNSTTALLTLTQGSGITNGGATGILTIVLTEAQATAFSSNDLFYVLSYASAGFNYNCLQGGLTLVADANPESTTSSVSVSVSLAGTNVTAAITLGSDSVVQATTTVAGKVELATNAETITGTDTERATTPAGVKAAIDAAVVGLWDDRGNYDASVNTFPASGGSGTAGAILKGDIWRITVGGTLGGTAVVADQTVRALVDTPGQTAGNWAISGGGSVAQTVTDGVTTSAPSQDAVYDFVTTQVASATAVPGVYFAPAQAFDPSFVVFASAIIRPNTAYVVNNPITWEILSQSSSHNSSFIESAAGDSGTTRLVLTYPTVKNVINSTMTVDEGLASYNVFVGGTVGLSSASYPAYMTYPLSIKLRGQGTSTWAVTGPDTTVFTTGSTPLVMVSQQTYFNINDTTGLFTTDYNTINIQYIGTNNYGIRRVYSSLGSYNISFKLVDRATGLDVATNPTSNDEVVITNCGMYRKQLDLYKYTTAAPFLGGLSNPNNFWFFGVFECFMVAAPVSTTSILVRWQAYPSATSYKIYRDTSSSFSSQVLIYSGTNRSYLDTGRTTATLYYYKMVAVISGVDTTITTFKTNTF